MKKRISFSLLLTVLVISCISLSFAEIFADDVFNNVSTTLTSSKTASFSAETFNNQSSIKVTRVRLYRQNGNYWILIGDLPVPTDEATNTNLYGATKNYSSDIGTGTYRLLTTFTADGHSISRYSNTKTY